MKCAHLLKRKTKQNKNKIMIVKQQQYNTGMHIFYCVIDYCMTIYRLWLISLSPGGSCRGNVWRLKEVLPSMSLSTLDFVK